jgi:hypothetical protein
MRFIFILLSVFLSLHGCVYRMSMRSADGESLTGRYRMAGDDTGLIQVMVPGGEVLNGRLLRIARASFIDGYQKTFGKDSIAVDGPEVFFAGNAFGSIFGNSSALADAAYEEPLDRASGAPGKLVSGPLYYWTASLQGDRGTSMGCYFIQSSYTARSLGRCKSHSGKEYSAEL